MELIDPASYTRRILPDILILNITVDHMHVFTIVNGCITATNLDLSVKCIHTYLNHSIVIRMKSTYLQHQ